MESRERDTVTVRRHYLPIGKSLITPILMSSQCWLRTGVHSRNAIPAPDQRDAMPLDWARKPDAVDTREDETDGRAAAAMEGGDWK